MSSLDFDEDDEKKLLFVAVESGDGIGLLKNRKKVKKKHLSNGLSKLSAIKRTWDDVVWLTSIYGVLTRVRGS